MIERIRRINPEVLAPAGSLETLKKAVDFGADAIYCGGKSFGMRAAPKNFSLDDFVEGVAYAHKYGAKLYVTCNIMPDCYEVAPMMDYMRELAEIGVDALIVSDIGMLVQAQDLRDKVDFHISTQAGVTNYQTAATLYELGASRVVLAREVTLEGIKAIRDNAPSELEIEAFVHGSMCMAFSGRCMISKYMTGRDANHGDCAQPCRWHYTVQEDRRPDKHYDLEIGPEGSYLFNSQDMNMLAHLDKVIEAGVTSLKIEGRAKSSLYVAALTNAYKTAVDLYMQQRGFETAEGKILRPFNIEAARASAPVTFGQWKVFSEDLVAKDPSAQDEELPAEEQDQPTEKNVPGLVPVEHSYELPQWLLEEPYKVTYRDYCTGFYFPLYPASQITHSSYYVNTWRVVGECTGFDAAEQRLYLYSKNKIVPGQEVELLLPGRAPIRFELPEKGLLDDKGEEVEEIREPLRVYSIPFDLSKRGLEDLAGAEELLAGGFLRARQSTEHLEDQVSQRTGHTRRCNKCKN